MKVEIRAFENHGYQCAGLNKIKQLLNFIDNYLAFFSSLISLVFLSWEIFESFYHKSHQ